MDIGNENRQRTPLLHIDQLIMNPMNFSVNEKEVADMSKVADAKKILLRLNIVEGAPVKIDLIGGCMLLYMDLVTIANTMCSTIIPLLLIYNKSKDTVKS